MRIRFTSDVERASPEQLLREADAALHLASTEKLMHLRERLEGRKRRAWNPRHHETVRDTRNIRETLYRALRRDYVDYRNPEPTTRPDLEADFAVVAQGKGPCVHRGQEDFVRRLFRGLAEAQPSESTPLDPIVVWGIRLELAILLTDHDLVHKVG
jgi:hypothetical protein